MNNLQLSEAEVSHIIDLALAEDTAHGDITSEVLLPDDLYSQAAILVKEEGVLAGGEVARRVFLQVDPSLEVSLLISDGGKIKLGDIIATVAGRVSSILKAERVALNFLQRLSGIASLTARYVAEVSGCPASIYDTRKTTPGLRALEKYAVRMGGGKNHRLHLGDGILIKDNHIAALRARGMSLGGIITRAKESAPEGIKVEVEVTNAREALDAAAAGVDIIMLDNMSPDATRRVVSKIRGQAKIEASGGITLANVRQAAMAGVDIISIGALTHSPQALDISLELETKQP